MKKTLTLIAFALGSTAAFSQQDPQFSQYMYNKLFMNPAYAGMRQALCATTIYRNQWQGFDGSPKSIVFSADAFLPQIKGGVGLNIVHDKLGFETNMGFRANYSFHLPVGGGLLGIGLEWIYPEYGLLLCRAKCNGREGQNNREKYPCHKGRFS